MFIIGPQEVVVVTPGQPQYIVQQAPPQQMPPQQMPPQQVPPQAYPASGYPPPSTEPMPTAPPPYPQQDAGPSPIGFNVNQVKFIIITIIILTWQCYVATCS